MTFNVSIDFLSFSTEPAKTPEFAVRLQFFNLLTLLVPICAVSLKHSGGSYSILSLWLYPPTKRFSETHVFNPDSLLRLTETISESLSEHLKDFLESAVFIDNQTLTPRSLYSTLED